MEDALRSNAPLLAGALAASILHLRGGAGPISIGLAVAAAAASAWLFFPPDPTHGVLKLQPRKLPAPADGQITLYTFQACGWAPSASPPCLKLEVFLRLRKARANCIRPCASLDAPASAPFEDGKACFFTVYDVLRSPRPSSHLLQVPYKAVRSMVNKSSKGKLPWLVLPDGTELADSTLAMLEVAFFLFPPRPPPLLLPCVQAPSRLRLRQVGPCDAGSKTHHDSYSYSYYCNR